MSGGWGGAREGAGTKPAGYTKSTEQLDFERERAEHEKVKREQREFKLKVEMGQYCLREVQRQASATALSVLTQSLRSIPDNLERTLSLAPETVEAIAVQIDTALGEVAAAFRLMAES